MNEVMNSVNNVIMDNFHKTDNILNDVQTIIEVSQKEAYRSVNTILSQRNWLIGYRIAVEELAGEERAEYGVEIIKNLSRYLTQKYGKGYDRSNLYHCLRFYKAFPQIVDTACRQSDIRLTWSHYRTLLQVHDETARKWYEKEAYEQTWSVRTLQRNIDTQYYYRMLQSQDKKAVEAEMREKTSSYQNDKLEFIKNPVVVEFLGLTPDASFNETKLESSIITNLQKFLMEMGKGYAFVARQQHIHTEKQDYYIDLVFYNYILKCFVLIDLKTERITHQDVGQMDMYIRMYDELKKAPDDNPNVFVRKRQADDLRRSIGILLQLRLQLHNMLKLLRAEQNLLGSFFELMYNMLKGDKAMDKIVLSEYNECKRYILDELEKMSLPKEHPFLKYPRTPESRNLEFFILLKIMLGKESNIPKRLLHKCNAVEDGKFSHMKYLEGIDETLILYYILVVNIENISSVIYEPSHIWQNNKTLEYSCVFKMPTECMVNIEVKTMRCDPFEKETDLKINNIKDGSILIKKLVNDDIGYEKLLCEHQDAVELKNSTYYSAFNRNIKKIVEKFDGEKNIQCRMINIGFICIHFSTSIEEFYTYMFHKEKGIYKKLQWGNLDALVLFVLDARNDILLQNIYEMGYVATMLRNDTEINRKFMEIMRLDNFVLLGDKVVKSVYDEAQKGAKLYRILKRDGFLNILPYDSTEQGIEDYVNYLKSDSVRYE